MQDTPLPRRHWEAQHDGAVGSLKAGGVPGQCRYRVSAWQTVGGVSVPHSVSMRFQPTNRSLIILIASI